MTRRDGAGRATVMSAAASLWPASGTSTSRRRPPGAAHTFAVVPTMHDPRFLVPRSRAAALALGPASRGRRGLKMRALWLAQRSSLLHRLPWPRLHVSPGPPGEGIEDLLATMVGEVDAVVVRLGRPRPHRTLVLWALGDRGAALALAKLSTGSQAQQALEREFAVLAAAPGADVADLRAPEALGYVRWAGNDVLVISALVAAGARPSHEAPVAQMRALAAAGPAGPVALRETAGVARLRRELAGLSDEAERRWLEEALDALVVELGDVTVTTGAWHGDWVSWNMSLDGSTVLLWDWEHFEADALAGLDHVHFLAQELRAQATDAAAEDRWRAQVEHVLDVHWAMGAAQRAVVVRAYLIEVNLRFVQDRQGEDAAQARDGWARPLLERLAAADVAQA